MKNIVFDFGGVIFDLDYDNAIKTFQSIGLEDAHLRLDRYHQRGIFEDLESGRMSTDEFRRQLEPLCHRTLTYNDVLGAWLGYVGAPVDEQKLAYLDSLRSRGYRTFLLSNTNPYVQAWAESSRFSKSGRPLSSYLDKCYCSFEVGIMKPDPAIFRLLMSDAQLQPTETLFLDDSPANIAAADALGIQTLLVEKNGDWREQVEARLAD